VLVTPLAIVVVLSCTEYGLNAGKDELGVLDTSTVTDSWRWDSATDTGEPSTGPDCLDETYEGEPAWTDESCEFEPTVGTFTPVLKWASPAPGDVYATPVIGNLTDDDGDGDIDQDDIPDVVVAAYLTGETWVLSGDDGHVHWHAGGVGAEPMSPAIGDLDGDGVPEVVASGVSGTQAFDGSTGALKWTGPAFSGVVTAQCGAVGIYDLDGNGRGEVLLGNMVLDGQTGSKVAQGQFGEGSGHGWAAPMGVAADVNADGRLEVVTGNALYDANLATLWHNREQDGFVAVADFDADVKGEIVATTLGSVRLMDDDGAILWRRNGVTGTTSGPPTVADFDNDGDPEIGVAGMGQYVVLDTDGTTLWTRTTNDYSSGFTGSSVFDFEGDGAAEVVYADENDVWVFDGATGGIKLRETRHSSATCSEYPAIADVDHDGNAEIIYASGVYSSNESGIRVIGDADDSWRPARPVWNQHAYAITNIEDDLSVPKAVSRNWDAYNNFRSGDVFAGSGGITPDLVVDFVAVCREECDEDKLYVWLRGGNVGMSDVEVDVEVALYGIAGESETALGFSAFHGIPVGEWSDAIRFSVSGASAYDDLLARIDGGNAAVGVIGECHEDNDEAVWGENLCD